MSRYIAARPRDLAGEAWRDTDVVDWLLRRAHHGRPGCIHRGLVGSHPGGFEEASMSITRVAIIHAHHCRSQGDPGVLVDEKHLYEAPCVTEGQAVNSVDGAREPVSRR